MIGESFAVCKLRLQMLIEAPSLLVAFNFSDFLFSNIFDSDKRSSSLIVRRWMENVEQRGEDVSGLLDAHLGLMYKLKKDSMQIEKSVN